MLSDKFILSYDNCKMPILLITVSKEIPQLLLCVYYCYAMQVLSTSVIIIQS